MKTFITLLLLVFITACTNVDVLNATTTPPPTVTLLPSPTVAPSTEVSMQPTATADVSPTAVSLKPTATAKLTAPEFAEPTAIQTTEPTATNAPTVPPPPRTVAEIVDEIIAGLNGHQREDYPITQPFFSGVYGGRIFVDASDFYSPQQLLRPYAGDTYGLRALAISADPITPLPIPFDQATALNPTDLPVSAIVHSTGWGYDQPAEALFYFTEQDGEPRWMGAIFSYDGFAALPEYEVVQPMGDVQAYLDNEDSMTAIRARLAERFHIDSNRVAVNPSQTTAVVMDSNHQYGLYQYRIVALADDSVAVYQGEVGQDFVVTDQWLDDQRLLVKYHLATEDYPVAGHLAVLDVVSAEITPIPDTQFQFGKVSTTPSGAVVINGENPLRIWQAGENRSLDITPMLDMGEPAGVGSVAVSADPQGDGSHFRYVIGVIAGDEEANGNMRRLYVWHDTTTGEAKQVASFFGFPMEGQTDPAIWNTAGSWAVISPWASFTEHDRLTLVKAATGETRNLGIHTTKPRWVNDDLLLFNAYDGTEMQTHFYDVTSGEQMILGIEEAVVEEDSAETPLQDITFPQLQIRMQAPISWTARYDYRGSGSINMQSAESIPELRYGIWIEPIANPDNLPVAQAYANQYTPELVDEITAGMSIARVGRHRFEAVRSDFIFSRSGALGYFFRSADHYILIAFGPYDAEQPFEGQAAALAQFETMIDTVDDQYLIGESAQPCSPLATDDPNDIAFRYDTTGCVVWREGDENASYRVELAFHNDTATGDIDYANYFVTEKAARVLPDDTPCFMRFQQLVRGGAMTVSVYVQHPSGEQRVTGMGITTHCAPP